MPFILLLKLPEFVSYLPQRQSNVEFNNNTVYTTTPAL